MSAQHERWDEVHRKYPPEALPWELGRARKVLVDLIESGKVNMFTPFPSIEKGSMPYILELPVH